MQLKSLLVVVLVFAFSLANGQADADTLLPKKEKFEASFLASYYQQDGNHSAVTGGIGTEKLNNIAPSYSMNIPLSATHVLKINGGVDYYSSASSDNIDNPNRIDGYVSGASSADFRGYTDVAYHYKKKQSDYGFKLGFSSEFDVLSVNGGFSYGFLSKNENHSFEAGFGYFYDNWKLIYPVELRNGTVNYLDVNNRQSFHLDLTATSVLNKRMQASISSGLVLQKGLLSTPFHRVYFAGEPLARIEMAPNSRLKIPVGVRLNTFVTDFFILKAFYRFYYDDFDIHSHTIKIDAPIIISQWLRVYPQYRYYMQTAAFHFVPYMEADPLAEFYTSDYDLSAFSSQMYSLGARITPLFGFGRIKHPTKKDKVILFHSIDIKYSDYRRSDGLNANIWSLALNFKTN